MLANFKTVITYKSKSYFSLHLSRCCEVYVFKDDMRLLLYNLFAASFHIKSMIIYGMTVVTQHVDVPYSFGI